MYICIVPHPYVSVCMDIYNQMVCDNSMRICVHIAEREYIFWDRKRTEWDRQAERERKLRRERERERERERDREREGQRATDREGERGKQGDRETKREREIGIYAYS